MVIMNLDEGVKFIRFQKICNHRTSIFFGSFENDRSRMESSLVCKIKEM